MTGTDVVTTSGALVLRPEQTQFSDEQLAVLRHMGIPRQATAADLQVFLHRALALRLDPFAGQIHLIDYGGKPTIQVGIHGWEAIARDSADESGVSIEWEDTQWCGPDGVWRDVWLADEPPAAARAVLLRDGKRYPAVCLYREFVGMKKVYRDKVWTGEWAVNSMWESKPAHMLAKCLPGKARIHTDRGTLMIRDIVHDRLPVRVRSIDLATGHETWAPIISWWTNPPTREWVRLWTPGGRGNKPLRLTPDHPVWTPHGWTEAGRLRPGDHVAVTTHVPSPEQHQVILGGMLGDAHLAGRKRPSSLPFLEISHSIKQADYAKWTRDALLSLGAKSMEFTAACQTGHFDAVQVRTPTHASLLRYRETSPLQWLDELDVLGLAVWFMDDGNLSQTDAKTPSWGARLFCLALGTEFADAAVDWFQRRHGIAARVLYRRDKPYLAFGVAATQTLLRLIAPYLAHDGSRKRWIARPIEQGHDGFVFLPVLRMESVTRVEAESRYDIEVEGTHTFVVGGVVISNCTRAAALRSAFPRQFADVRIPEELGERPGTIRGQVIDSEPVKPDPLGSALALVEAATTRDELLAIWEQNARSMTVTDRARLQKACQSAAANLETTQQGTQQPPTATEATNPGTNTSPRLQALTGLLEALGYLDPADQTALCSRIVGDVASLADLDPAQVNTLIQALQPITGSPDPQTALDDLLTAMETHP